MPDGLAFLSTVDFPEGMIHLRSNIPEGMTHLRSSFPEGMTQLRSNIPEGLEQLVKYFDQTYVSGSLQRVQLSPAADGTVQPIRMRRIFPVYIPTIWHVHDMTVNGGSRTNNMCEAWNRGFSTLVGHAHPTIWTLIEALCKDFSSVEGTKRLNQLGQPPRNQAPQPARLTSKEQCASTS